MMISLTRCTRRVEVGRTVIIIGFAAVIIQTGGSPLPGQNIDIPVHKNVVEGQ